MPRAAYDRAASRTLKDSLAGIAITVLDSAHTPLQAADIQVWGPKGAAGGPGNASGTTAFPNRDPGLYSLRIRMSNDGPRWIYAATLRPGFFDTVEVNVNARCTSIWHGD